MNNVIDLRRASAGLDAARPLLADPPAHTHAVQFYEDDERLLETLAHYLGEGLQNGDVLLVVATAPHREGLLRRLEAFGGVQALECGRITMLDAHETLARFMRGDMPDAQLFNDMLDQQLQRVSTTGMIGSTSHGHPRVRAYGEMVDVLWREGNSRAAIRLEELWEDARKRHSFVLLCAYLMGNFYREDDAARFLEVCRNHSHVLPTERFMEIDDAAARLREISSLQQRASALEHEVAQRKQLEAALRDALRERGRAEDELRAALDREREARERAEANDAFKEVFLGVLGHDLRNPLNTILMTSRLMMMSGEIQGDSTKRINRVVSSGVRMQRMVDQLLDMTRARLGGGIPVVYDGEHDLVALVAKVVEDLRIAYPQRIIDFAPQGSCVLKLDGDRFEQVVANLVGNALAHGDAAKPIRVEVIVQTHAASVKVHNHGTPIDPEFLPLLFDPFKRAAQPRGGATGLGLGLYISERIVAAHGGTIEVDSRSETGTTFEVIIPR